MKAPHGLRRRGIGSRPRRQGRRPAVHCWKECLNESAGVDPCAVVVKRALVLRMPTYSRVDGSSRPEKPRPAQVGFSYNVAASTTDSGLLFFLARLNPKSSLGCPLGRLSHSSVGPDSIATISFQWLRRKWFQEIRNERRGRLPVPLGHHLRDDRRHVSRAYPSEDQPGGELGHLDAVHVQRLR